MFYLTIVNLKLEFYHSVHNMIRKIYEPISTKKKKKNNIKQIYFISIA